jgi:5-methylcytosine-specific restriction enzyme A
MAGKWDHVRRTILSRDGECCVRCHYPACDVHHRKPKGMGGTSDEEVAFGLANLISLCRECHSYIHAHPAESYKLGYLVRSWDNPELVKIETNLGSLEIRSDGTFEQIGTCELFLHR